MNGPTTVSPSGQAQGQGALLVVGATSGAGKSTVVSALCRAWRRKGLAVAPFKAQNMSNHSAVTADGGEVGRAQAMQAAAAGVPLDRRMNPVLFKPSSDRRSRVVVLGDELDDTGVHDQGAMAARLRPVVLDALGSLRTERPWLVAEGAGGAAEINLLDNDLVNMPLAAAAGMPAVLVVDIDRGGAFASAYGTLALLPPELRRHVVGVVFNRFRGDPALLEPGLRDFEARCGVDVLGTLPHLGPEPMFGLEDALDLDAPSGSTTSPRATGSRPLRVAVIRLPHLANPSDLDPLRIEADVELRWVTRPEELDHAELAIVPGSRATVTDLAWLRQRGFADALARCPADVVGVCAGYQMLGRSIHDEVESRAGAVDGLGLLDVHTVFAAPKVVRLSAGTADGQAVAGYQIRFGRPESDEAPWFDLDGAPEGAVDPSGRVRGTSLHGLFDRDGFRTCFLTSIAERHRRSYQAGPHTFAEALDRQHDHLADWLTEHVDIDHLAAVAATAAAPGAGPGW